VYKYVFKDVLIPHSIRNCISGRQVHHDRIVPINMSCGWRSALQITPPRRSDHAQDISDTSHLHDAMPAPCGMQPEAGGGPRGAEPSSREPASRGRPKRDEPDDRARGGGRTGSERHRHRSQRYSRERGHHRSHVPRKVHAEDLRRRRHGSLRDLQPIPAGGLRCSQELPHGGLHRRLKLRQRQC